MRVGRLEDWKIGRLEGESFNGTRMNTDFADIFVFVLLFDPIPINRYLRMATRRPYR